MRSWRLVADYCHKIRNSRIRPLTASARRSVIHLSPLHNSGNGRLAGVDDLNNNTLGNAGGSQSVISVAGTPVIGDADVFAIGAAHTTNSTTSIVSGGIHVLVVADPWRGACRGFRRRRAIR